METSAHLVLEDNEESGKLHVRTVTNPEVREGEELFHVSHQFIQAITESFLPIVLENKIGMKKGQAFARRVKEGKIKLSKLILEAIDLEGSIELVLHSEDPVFEGYHEVAVNPFFPATFPDESKMSLSLLVMKNLVSFMFESYPEKRRMETSFGYPPSHCPPSEN
jgi:hypothetical protein